MPTISKIHVKSYRTKRVSSFSRPKYEQLHILRLGISDSWTRLWSLTFYHKSQILGVLNDEKCLLKSYTVLCEAFIYSFAPYKEMENIWELVKNFWRENSRTNEMEYLIKLVKTGCRVKAATERWQVASFIASFNDYRAIQEKRALKKEIITR